jgi:hypothetical protein
LFRERGSGYRVQGTGFRVQGSGYRVQGTGFRVQGSGYRVQGTGFRANSGFRDQDAGDDDRCPGNGKPAKSYLPARALTAAMGQKVKPVKKAATPEKKKPGEKHKALPPGEKGGASDEEGFLWRSAISFSAESTATLLRTVLEGLGAKFRRTRSERSYSQLYAVLPYPRVAYVFRFEITEPCELVIDLYDTYPATSGALTFMEMPAINDGNIDGARKILRALVASLPRPPWKFTAVQRVQHGLLEPAILRARKNWRAIGIAD